jgi:hypothetical protein
MKKTDNIKKVTILFVFILSFVFQTAYSLTFKVPSSSLADYCHKHVEKSAAKEELSDGSFMEDETEKDNELDFEITSFIVPQFFYQVVVETDNAPQVSAPLALSSFKESIFVVIHNFRI